MSDVRPDRPPEDRGSWEPQTVYLVGDTVLDDASLGDAPSWIEQENPPGRRYRCLKDHRSGELPPRFAVIDLPGERWEEIRQVEGRCPCGWNDKFFVVGDRCATCNEPLPGPDL